MGSGCSCLRKSNKDSKRITEPIKIKAVKYQVPSTSDGEEPKRQTPKNIKGNLMNIIISKILMILLLILE